MNMVAIVVLFVDGFDDPMVMLLIRLSLFLPELFEPTTIYQQPTPPWIVIHVSGSKTGPSPSPPPAVCRVSDMTKYRWYKVDPVRYAHLMEPVVSTVSTILRRRGFELDCSINSALLLRNNDTSKPLCSMLVDVSIRHMGGFAEL